MKNYTLLPLLFVILVISTGYGQWFPTNGPGGGPVYDIQKFGNRLFLASGDGDLGAVFYGGVFTSDDNGQTWVLRHQGFQNCRVTSLLQYNNKIYAGTTAGIFISSDNGNTWTVSSAGLLNGTVKCLAVKDNVLYAGNDGAGLHKSTDEGLTWTNLFTSTSVNKIYVDGADIYLLGPGGGAFQKSTDNGQTWTNFGMLNGIFGTGSNGFVRRGTELFLSTYNGGIYKSINSGQNWTGMSGGPAGPGFLSLSGDTLWTSNVYGNLLVLAPGSSTWQALPNSTEAPAITSLYKSGGTKLIGTSKGLIRMEGSGIPECVASIPSSKIRGMIHNQGRLFASTETGVYYSDNQGQSWTRSYYYNPQGTQAILKWKGVILAGTLNQGTVKSEDNGITWRRTGFSLPVGAVNEMVQSGNTILAAIQGEGLYKTQDTGTTWTKIMTYPYSSAVSLRKVLLADGINFRLFSTTGNSRTYFSSDTGATWTQCTFTQPSTGPSSARLLGVIQIGGVLYANTYYHFYKSTNNGLSWTYSDFPSLTPTVLSSCGLFADSNFIYVPIGSRILRTADAGMTWLVDTVTLSSMNNSTYSPPLINGIWDLGGNKYLGTDGLGVWKFGSSPNPVQGEISGLAKERLLRIFPNPGNGKLQLQLTNAIPAGTRISIFNNAGKCLLQIDAGQLSPESSLVWNASSLPRGLYHYSLRGPSIAETGRVILE